MVIPFDSPWRHGVYAFVVSPLLWLFASAVRVAIGALGGPQRWPVAIAAAAVGTAATAVSVLVALVVAVSLVVDARSNGPGPAWLPGQWLASLLGLAHVAGAVLTFPYLVSVPGIGYYAYRRWHAEERR